jgi:hypothetical protein
MQPDPQSAVPAPQLGRALAPSFGVGSVLSRTLSVWWENVLVFSGVALLLQSPALVGTVILGAPVGAPDARREIARALLNALTGLLSLVVSGALTFGVIQSLRGKTVRFGEILGVGASRSWRIFVVALGAGLVILGFSLLLIVPGIMAACALFLAVPAAVVEPDRPALRRSRELTKGHRLTIFLLFVVFWLVGMVATGIAGFATVLSHGPPSTGLLLFVQLAGVIAGGLGSTWPAVAYHDLRVEKEGVDTAELARVFE